MRQEKRRNARQEKGKFQERVTYDEETGGSPLANMPGDQGAPVWFAVLLLIVSVFLSFHTAIAASLVIAVAVMLDDGRRRRLLAIPYARLLLGFLIVPFFVAAMYNNLRGILCLLCSMPSSSAGLLLRSATTRALFGRMLDWACCCSVGWRASGRGSEAGVLAGYAGIPACLHVHKRELLWRGGGDHAARLLFPLSDKPPVGGADGISLPPLRICAGFT